LPYVFLPNDLKFVIVIVIGEQAGGRASFKIDYAGLGNSFERVWIRSIPSLHALDLTQKPVAPITVAAGSMSVAVWAAGAVATAFCIYGPTSHYRLGKIVGGMVIPI
jgi:hypothetical protein